MVKAFNSFSVMNRTATFLSLFPNIELKHKAWVESLKATYEKLKWSYVSPYLLDNLGWFKAKWSDYLDYSEKHMHAHSLTVLYEYFQLGIDKNWTAARLNCKSLAKTWV